MVEAAVSELGLLLALKAKEYFGPVRTQPRRLVLSLLNLAILGGVGFAYGFLLLAQPAGSPVGGAAASAATALSLFLGVSILAALSGGVLVLPLELDFVLTSPVPARRYLQASAIFQVLATQLSTLPLLPLMVGFALARHYSPYWLPVAVVGYEAFLLLTVLFAQALGILVMTSRPGAKWAVAAMLGLFLLPLLGLVTTFPRYQDLPLPSTLYVASLQILLGMPTPFPWAPAGFLAYLGAAYGVHSFLARRDVVPHLRPNVALGFGDALHPGVLRQRLAGQVRRPRRTVGDLRPEGGPLPLLLLRLHFLRLARERGVLTILLFFLLVVLVPAVLVSPTGVSAQVATSAVLYTALVGPTLVFAWNTSERATLWIPLTAGPHGRAYFQTLFLAFATISIAMPSLVLTIGAAVAGAPAAWRVAALPMIALASCGLALLLALARPAPAMASPGLGPLGGLVLPVAGSYLLSLPALFADLSLMRLGPGATVLLLGGYAAALGLVLWLAIGWVSSRVRA